jgi:hypothetical protein
MLVLCDIVRHNFMQLLQINNYENAPRKTAHKSKVFEISIEIDMKYL